MITKAIRDRLNSDAGITAQLGTFDFGSGNAAAIFAFDDPNEQPPGNVSGNCIFIRAAGGTDFSDRGSQGARLTFRVIVWGDRARESILDLARDIWLRLNKATLTQTGWHIYGVLCTPPAFLSDPDGYPGYLVNVNAFVERA